MVSEMHGVMVAGQRTDEAPSKQIISSKERESFCRMVDIIGPISFLPPTMTFFHLSLLLAIPHCTVERIQGSHHRMSGLDALEELQLNIQDALDQELSSSARPTLDKQAFSAKVSVRDLGKQLEDESINASTGVSRTELLESWHSLVQSLFSMNVFLQYTHELEGLFVRLNLDDDSDRDSIKTLLDLMTETVNNCDKDPSTECRYVTLMEVLMSYASNWELSQQVQRLWEAQDEFIDSSVSADEFRQMAYGVLMLLPWVPNSSGLREACSIPDDDSIDDEEVPLAVESVFDQIRSNRPIPRHDAIHRILSHLESEENATVAITSTVDESFHESVRRSHGIGKTTMAALVASSPQVQADYDVLWLRLSHRTSIENDESGTLTYLHYVEYLNALCKQIGLEREWPKPMRVLEEGALQKKRDEEKMFQLKTEMAQLLRENTSDLLLVLDDVQDDLEIEWFRFLDHQSFVVTTQSQNLSVTWKLDVELLTEDEALELFLTEADYAPDDPLANSLEAKSVVQRCGLHPLTIRMVGRWFSLKEATAGVVKALEELDQELSSCTAKLRHCHSYKSNPEYILAEVMNLTVSPVLTAGGHPTSLMKTCLSSMAVVFEHPVPREAVVLLWTELFLTEPQVVAELGGKLSSRKIQKRVHFMLEALVALGLIGEVDKDETVYLEISHKSQLDYATSLARELHFGVDEKETAEQWHRAFVNAYLTKKADDEVDELEHVCQEYAYKNIVHHMIRARKYSKAVKLLGDDRFLVERFTAEGFETATKLHLQDCKELLNAMESDGDSNEDPYEVVASIYTKVAAFVIAEAQEQGHDTFLEAGKAVHELGFALAENGFSPEAVLQYKSALKILPKKSHISCDLLYGMGAINLLRNEYSKCLKNLNDCLKGMGENDTTTGVFYAEIVLLKGDALLAQCDYEEAMKCYDDTLKVLLCDPTNNRVEIGIAMYRKGMLHYARGEKEDALRILCDSIALKDKIGESSANFATAYYFAGHLLADQNRIPEAIDYFEKAIHMMKDNLDEVESVDIYLTTGKLCELRDDMDGCLDAFDLALKEIRDAPRMEFDRAMQDLRSIASVSMRLGDYVGAIPILDEGLDLTENRSYSLARASMFFDLGLCESKQGDYQESAYHYEQALKIQKKKLGESELVIETLIKLGETYKMMEKLDDSLSFYNDALEATEKLYGEDNERVASLLYLLGDIKESTKETMEALANFEECLEIRRRNLDITSLLIAETLERIGSIYTEQENPAKAYTCFTEALDIRQASSDPNDPALVESLFQIGVAARKQGDCERSLHFLLDALRIREKHDQQREMCETLLEIGHVHRQLADNESARGCYDKCLEMVHEFYGKSDIMAVDVLLALGQIHRSNGDTVQALKCLDEGKFWTSAVMICTTLIPDSETNLALLIMTALSLRTNISSRDDMRLATLYWSIGMAKFESENFEDAMKYLEDFVKMQDAKKIRNVEYVVALQCIGDMHQHFDNGDSARTAWSNSFRTYSSSKEMVSRYPELGPMLDRRQVSGGEENEVPPSEPETIGANMLQMLVGQLSEEVNNRKENLDRDPAELAFYRSIFLED